MKIYQFAAALVVCDGIAAQHHRVSSALASYTGLESGADIMATDEELAPGATGKVNNPFPSGATPRLRGSSTSTTVTMLFESSDDCNAKECINQCIAGHGGDGSSGNAYMCSKACAGMSGGRVKNPDKFCDVEAADRYENCLNACSGASSKESNRDICREGCEFWKFKMSPTKGPSISPTKSPSICPANVDWVCGRNRKNYQNKCKARRAGVKVASKGKCLEPRPNLVCPANVDPVCGRNRKTYDNKCKAKRAGVKVARKGRCKKSDINYEESNMETEEGEEMEESEDAYDYEESNKYDYEESDMEMEETEEITVPETGNPSLRGGAVLAD